MATSLTIEILNGIRDEVKETNVRVEGLRDEVKETNIRIEGLRDALSRRIVESEVRTSTAIAELAGTVREMTSVLRAQSDLRPRVEKCEREIEELKKRA